MGWRGWTLGLLLSVAWCVGGGVAHVEASVQSVRTSDHRSVVFAGGASATSGGTLLAASATGPATGHAHHAKYSPAWPWLLPFAVMLGMIALIPVIHPHWWEHKYPYLAVVLFLVGMCYYLFVRGDMRPWFAEMREYFSFIALLFALFVISGGIVIDVSRKATPTANVVLLLLGAINANVLGTTGAAMLLIRPYIRINRNHIKPYHIVFFIFIVANVGGGLTPVGDPPLFLGFLKGVPFWWVLNNCWAPWLVTTGILLGLFYLIDWRDHAKQQRTDWGADDTGPAVQISGIHNFLFVALVLGAVFRPSVFTGARELWTAGFSVGALMRTIFSRELLMIGAAVAAKLVTKRGIYRLNQFSYGPIFEVAILFLAIFSTMVPALEWLDANADKMPLKSPGQYFFTTGGLSSVLDNAPTYLTFLQTRLGEVPTDQFEQARDVLAAVHQRYRANPQRGLFAALPDRVQPRQVHDAVRAMAAYHPQAVRRGEIQATALKIAFLVGVPANNIFLVAISLGAVFFGAFTYIGNAPNLMVKSIADSYGVATPSFFGYVMWYSVPVLVPIYLVVWAVFF